MTAPADADEGFRHAYLRRLGLADAGPAGLAGLRDLHAAHLEHVPFENLSIHLGEPLSLEPAALADKVLRRGRGGFCYELNGLFARFLELLGYRVTLLAARVARGESFGPPLAHLALRVDTAGGDGPWLADVGFGDHSLYPLRWEDGADQDDPCGTFRLHRTSEGDWDVYRDGVVQYRIEDRPRVLADFEAMCWYQQNSPLSHFTRSLVCTRRTADGRVTLSGRRLITTTARGPADTELAGDALVLDTYRKVFGIDLDRVPVVGGGQPGSHST